MLCVVAPRHLSKVLNYPPCCKEGSVHPSSSLFHKHHKTVWGICVSFGIRNVGQVVTTVLFNVDLKTHDSVLGQVFICLSHCWLSFRIHQLEKGIHWPFLDSLPSEHAICSWQHRIKPKSALECLVRGMTHLVFIELGSSNKK